MILSAKAVHRDFSRSGKNSNVFTAVQPLNIDLASGMMVEITGRSGSGKSTLLNMLAGMLKPTSGHVFLDDTDIYTLDDNKLSGLRNEKIGFVPQGHTALLGLTVLENVLLPSILYSNNPPPEDRAKELLGEVGLLSLQSAKPNELSGGELRRMAFARALLMEPPILLADEPTAGLDEENMLSVLRLLRKNADKGTAVLFVTHENEAAQFADEIFTMEAGKFI